MKILVTGGSGFIGSSIVRKLVMNGHDVVSVDIAKPTRATDGYHYQNCDLLDFEKTLAVVKDADVVYHIAGVVLEYVRKNPFLGSALNVNMTRNVIEACRLNKVPKLVFASSFYVYDGIDPTFTVDEDTSLATNRMELFGATKVFGENLIREYSKFSGLRYVILRFGSAYGIGNCTNVVKEFLELGRANKVIEVWGPGNRRNQYTYVEDIAEGSVLAIGAVDRVFNLVSPQETTVKELTEFLRTEYNFQASYRLDKKEGASMPHMLSQRAIEEIGWKPRRLEDGIREMVARYEREISVGQSK